MERHGGDGHPNHFATTSSFPIDGGHHHYDHRQDHVHGSYHQQHQPDHRNHQNFNGEQNESTGHHLNSNSSHSLPLSGQKRSLSYSNNADYGGFVKLYVVGLPRTATEQDISAVFGEFGHIVEVVLLKDKRTGLQQECCFVKYATVEQAEQSIAAFNSQFTFPGAGYPMRVKYADGERERLGSFGRHVHKLYVGCLNKQALKWEIEEIFSPFGVIEEIFIVRDEFKQNKGCAFVQFSCREMAIAAIQALHGTYVMKGCDQPLIVRFADPKKPRTGDSRSASYPNDHSNGYVLSSEMPQMKASNSGVKASSTVATNGTSHLSHASGSVAEIEHAIECDWSEHVSPDGDLYYYNCVTCESRWEKPDEYALYERELDISEEQQQQQESKLQVLSSPEMSEAQKV